MCEDETEVEGAGDRCGDRHCGRVRVVLHAAHERPPAQPAAVGVAREHDDGHRRVVVQMIAMRSDCEGRIGGLDDRL
jgi:hypothetical protein